MAGGARGDRPAAGFVTLPAMCYLLLADAVLLHVVEAEQPRAAEQLRARGGLRGQDAAVARGREVVASTQYPPEDLMRRLASMLAIEFGSPAARSLPAPSADS